MTIPTLHPPLKDSPGTVLTDSINSGDTILKVQSASDFQSAGITRLSLGIDGAYTETVTVNSYISSTQINVTRGSPAYSWSTGTKVSRVLTAEDINDIHQYLGDLNTRMVSNGNTHNHTLGAGSQIPTAGIENNSISSEKVIDSAITEQKLAPDSVTTSKILDQSITYSKLTTFPRVRVYKAAAQVIANDTGTIIIFNSEEYDTNSMHSNSVDNTLIKINTAGIYIAVLSLMFAANATGYRQAWISKAGFEYIGGTTVPGISGIESILNVTAMCHLDAGDVLYANVYQNSGGNLNILAQSSDSPYLSVTYIGS